MTEPFIKRLGLEAELQVRPQMLRWQVMLVVPVGKEHSIHNILFVFLGSYRLCELFGVE